MACNYTNNNTASPQLIYTNKIHPSYKLAIHAFHYEALNKQLAVFSITCTTHLLMLRPTAVVGYSYTSVAHTLLI